MHYYTKKSVFSMVFHILNDILPSLFWVLLIFGFSEWQIGVITLVSALIHECGHIGYLNHIKKGAKRLYAKHDGLRIKAACTLSYREERRMYISGPLANIISAFITLPFVIYNVKYANEFFVINLANAASNLLPIEGYDGYGIIRSYFFEKDINGVWISMLRAFSCFLVFFFCLLSIYLIDRYGGGYWIFSIFFVSMIKQIDASNPR